MDTPAEDVRKRTLPDILPPTGSPLLQDLTSCPFSEAEGTESDKSPEQPNQTAPPCPAPEAHAFSPPGDHEEASSAPSSITPNSFSGYTYSMAYTLREYQKKTGCNLCGGPGGRIMIMTMTDHSSKNTLSCFFVCFFDHKHANTFSLPKTVKSPRPETPPFDAFEFHLDSTDESRGGQKNI